MKMLSNKLMPSESKEKEEDDDDVALVGGFPREHGVLLIFADPSASGCSSASNGRGQCS